MLHITKVAYGCSSLSELLGRVEERIASDGQMFMSTRYLPKRQSEILTGGSLYWIIKHQLVARATILGFRENAAGRHDIMLAPRVIATRPYPRRAHQGWRYLEVGEAPPDLDQGVAGGDPLPAPLAGTLADLGLL
jgi:hypothetical protein